jgi:hypothetical protein
LAIVEELREAANRQNCRRITAAGKSERNIAEHQEATPRWVEEQSGLRDDWQCGDFPASRKEGFGVLYIAFCCVIANLEVRINHFLLRFEDLVLLQRDSFQQ